MTNLFQSTEPRTTLSFYRYVPIEDPSLLRDQLYIKWNALGVFGRIYLASEGINAQLSLPSEKLAKFRELLDQDPRFKDTPFKIAVGEGPSFYKLILKVRSKILADGLEEIDLSKSGQHLNAEEWHQAMLEEDAILIDMRNDYEHEVGHFKNAICPGTDNFRQSLPKTKAMLEGKQKNKILMYCTGGIRCEKASAWLKSEGFERVFQLQGGIIEYAHQVQNKGERSRFLGKNFVFDERLGERITQDVLAHCHLCGSKADQHINCANPECHLLLIQCDTCKEEFKGCCSRKCAEKIQPAVISPKTNS